MQRMTPKNISLSVLVLGSQPETSGLMNKFISVSSLEAALPEVPERLIPFGLNNVNMRFICADTNIDHESAARADVILFCYNIHDKSSYDAMAHCLERIRNHYQGIFALVGCASDNTEPDKTIARLRVALDLALSSVYPSTYLDSYISRNNMVSCGVGQLILNFIADKALKLNQAMPVVTLTPAPEKILPARPTVDMQALLLHDGSPIIDQALTDYFTYQDHLGSFHHFIEWNEQNVHLKLTAEKAVKRITPTNFQVAVLCVDFTKENAIETLSFQVKCLMKSNSKMFFVLLSLNESPGVLTAKINKNMTMLIETLAKMYSYNFMGIHFNISQDKLHDQIGGLFNLLCDKYFSTKAEERALVAVFRKKHRDTMSGQFFVRTTVPKEGDLDLDSVIHNASRKDRRSCEVFKGLGWFDKDGKLSEAAPALIRERRQSLDMTGADYTQKMVHPSKVKQG